MSLDEKPGETKRCYTCDRDLPLGEFARAGRNYRLDCKSCVAKMGGTDPKVGGTESKICVRCFRALPRAAFDPWHSAVDGLHRQCRDCSEKRLPVRRWCKDCRWCLSGDWTCQAPANPKSLLSGRSGYRCAEMRTHPYLCTNDARWFEPKAKPTAEGDDGAGFDLDGIPF